MDNVLVTIVVAIIGSFSAALWGHYFISKRATRAKVDELASRVSVVENTMVREHNVKQLVEESIKPIEKGIEKLLVTMTEMQKTMVEMQVEHARQQVRQELLSENQKNKSSN